MNIEKWLEDNTWRGHVDEAALRELLKTHAIVPREPSAKHLSSWKQSSIGMTTRGVYEEMIKAAENG